MRLNKKGDLALSTNAIVVLIIAVIILGLIITFVTQVLGSAIDNITPEVERMPAPPIPSASNAITTSQLIVGNAGKPFGLQISVFNPSATPMVAAQPTIVCAGVVESVRANPRDIAPRSFETYTVIGVVSDAAAEGKQLCSITVTPATPGVSSADLIIQVKG